MSRKFVIANRNQPLLLPVDLREWVPSDDLVHFVIEAVESLDLSVFKVNERGSGSAQYPPHMMLALLIYCYCNGIFSSRRIEQATYRDISVRYLTADTHPDHDTIARFRRENSEAFSRCFLRVLELGSEMGLVKVGTVSVDGTKVRANAGKHRSIRYDRAGELIAQLEQEVAELMSKAEEADAAAGPDGQSLPKEIARLDALKQSLSDACWRLEERARIKAEQQQPEYERKLAARAERKGRRKGKKPKPPDSTPKGSDQSNLTDPDSRLMRKNKREGYEQGYNAQAVVDADGSQLVLAARVSQCASDANELGKDIKLIPCSMGKPTVVLADSGYLDEDEVSALESEDQEHEMKVLVSVGSESSNIRRKHDFRPQKQDVKDPPKIRSEFVLKMKEKMEQEENRKLYSLRKQTVEPVFGVIKHCMGFRQFLLRGLAKVSAEWTLLTLSYNFKRLWNMKLKKAAAAAGN
jgi:transposase